MQTAVRATVSFRQPAHVIKFPDEDYEDDDDDEDEDDGEAGLLRQAERKTSIREIVAIPGGRHFDACAKEIAN